MKQNILFLLPSSGVSAQHRRVKICMVGDCQTSILVSFKSSLFEYVTGGLTVWSANATGLRNRRQF